MGRRHLITASTCSIWGRAGLVPDSPCSRWASKDAVGMGVSRRGRNPNSCRLHALQISSAEGSMLSGGAISTLLHWFCRGRGPLRAPARGLSSGATTMRQAEVKGKITKCIRFSHGRSGSGRAGAQAGKINGCLGFGGLICVF